jgi:hypothetical protein
MVFVRYRRQLDQSAMEVPSASPHVSALRIWLVSDFSADVTAQANRRKSGHDETLL